VVTARGAGIDADDFLGELVHLETGVEQVGLDIPKAKEMRRKAEKGQVGGRSRSKRGGMDGKGKQSARRMSGKVKRE